MPSGLVFAQTADIATEEEIAAVTGSDIKETNRAKFIFTPVIPEVMAKNKITIEDDFGLNIREAKISWLVNGVVAGQDVGMTDFTLELNNFDPVTVKAIVSYGNGLVYKYEQTVAAAVDTSNFNISEGFFMEHTMKNDQIEIKSQPTYPKIYQKVKYYIYSKDKALDLNEKQIIWYVNGKQSSPGLVGDKEFYTSFTNPGATTTIAVDIVGYGSQKDDEIYPIPRSDPRLKVNTSQPQRVLFCTADYARMIQNDVDSLVREYEIITRKIEDVNKNIDEDIDFLSTNYKSIDEDVTETASRFKDMGGGLMDGIMNMNLKSIAKSLKDIGKFINDNAITARLKYVTNKIEYYRRLQRWYESETERIQNRITSQKAQAKYKYDRCLEMAKKKPDFSPTIRRY